MWSVVFLESRTERLLTSLRAMPETHVLSLGSRAEQSLCHTTTSLKTRVSLSCFTFSGCDLPLNQEKRLEYVLPEVSLILAVSMATSRCLEPLETSNSRRALSSHPSSKSSQHSPTLLLTPSPTTTNSLLSLVMVRIWIAPTRVCASTDKTLPRNMGLPVFASRC